MRDDSRRIRSVVRNVRQDHEDISVVRCTDGTYGITQNGTLLPGLNWGEHELDECLAFAQRFSQTDRFPNDDGYLPTAE